PTTRLSITVGHGSRAPTEVVDLNPTARAEIVDRDPNIPVPTAGRPGRAVPLYSMASSEPPDDRLRERDRRRRRHREEQRRLMQLELHDQEALCGLDAVDPRVERRPCRPAGLAWKRGQRSVPGRAQRVRRRGGHGVAAVLLLHAEIAGRGALPDGVGEPAVDEDQRPLALLADRLDERLDQERPADRAL